MSDPFSTRNVLYKGKTYLVTGSLVSVDKSEIYEIDTLKDTAKRITDKRFASELLRIARSDYFNEFLENLKKLIHQNLRLN